MTTLFREQNGNWKGGITPENQKIRASMEYGMWRSGVWAIDSFACRHCGEDRGGNLVAHHILNFAEWPELRLALDNGITLCEKCHIAFHKKYGVRHNTREQLEEFLKS